MKPEADGILAPLGVLAGHYRDSGQQSAGIAAFYDELSGQTSERIADELGDGSLTGAELVRLLVRLAALRESLEEEKLLCSAAMVSLCQDRIRDEHASKHRAARL